MLMLISVLSVASLLSQGFIHIMVPSITLDILLNLKGRDLEVLYPSGLLYVRMPPYIVLLMINIPFQLICLK